MRGFSGVDTHNLYLEYGGSYTTISINTNVFEDFQHCISLYVNFASVKFLFYMVITLMSVVRGREDEPGGVLFILSPLVLLKMCKSRCMDYFKFFKFWERKHIQI